MSGGKLRRVGVRIVAVATAVSVLGGALLAGTAASAATLQVTIAAGSWTLDAAMAPDGSQVYAPNFFSDTVTVIDTATNTVVSTIPVADGPLRVAVSPDGAELYVTHQVIPLVSVITTATAAVTAVPLPSPAVGIAFAPDGGAVYAVSPTPAALYVLDPATRSIDATIPVADGALDVAFSPDGARAFVTSFASNTVTAIDTALLTSASTVAVNQAHSVAVSGDGSRLYVTQFSSNSVTVLNAVTLVVTATIPVAGTPSGVAVSPDGRRVLVGSINAIHVSVIDAAMNTVVETVAVGSGPAAVAFTPDGTRAYVAVTNSGVAMLALDAAAVITTTTLPSAVAGSAYSATIAATGAPAPTFAIVSGAPPAGVTLDPTTGELAGTPTESGAFTFTVRASNTPDGVPASDGQSFTLVVEEAPAITSASVPDAAVGVAYSATITAGGFPAPTFAVTSGALPAGLTLDGASGIVSGTPTAAGDAAFTVTASNTVAGATVSDAQTFAISVGALPAFTTSSLPSGQAGSAYLATIAATGSPAPTFAVTSGALPDGVVLDAVSGELSGTPTASGSFAFTVTASATVAGSVQSVERPFTLAIAAAPVAAGPVAAGPAAIPETGTELTPMVWLAAALLMVGLLVLAAVAWVSRRSRSA